MPELPEVTTTVNGINEIARGRSIQDVWSDWPKLIKSPTFAKFKKEISGRKIIGAKRRGKNILIELSGGKTLLIHMKMTGHVMYGKWRKATAGDKPGWKWLPVDDGEDHPLNDPYNRFIHLIFFLDNGHQLVLADVRKFAKVLLFSTAETESHADLQPLGPEPLEKELDFKTFREQLAKRPTWPIKQALMNQELIAGIGNIYSDEILWEAGIHPLQKVSGIRTAKMKLAYLAMKKILEKSIKQGGDSTSDYRNIRGERGSFQNSHMVYRRKGEACRKKGCGGKIERIIVAGRSAHFCNRHQRLIE